VQFHRSPWRVGRLALVIGAACATLIPVAASAQQVIRFNGKANFVGDAVELGRARVRINGKFTYGGPLDLGTTTATVRRLLDESGGAGELVKGEDGLDVLPVALPIAYGEVDWVKMVSLGSFRPTFRLDIKARGDGVYDFHLKVGGASIPENAMQCQSGAPSVALTTEIEIDVQGSSTPLTLLATTDWHSPSADPGPCTTGKLTASISSGSGGSDNEQPAASLRVENLTREEGVPNLMELDGSGSQDKDGSIVSYEFRAIDRDTGALVFGPQVTTESKLHVWFDPGDYTASLTVADDRGSISKPNTRSFGIQ
jgi:hypothetical protein